jgi:hypothetical protein
MQTEFKNKEEFIKFIVDGIASIIGDKDGELAKCTDKRMQKLDKFLETYKDHIRFFEVEVPSIVAGISERFSSFARGETTSEGVTTKKVMLGDVIIMDKSNINMPTGYVSKAELLEPHKLLDFCVSCLLKLYQKYVYSAKELIDNCTDEETASVVARTYHMMMAISGTEEQIILRSLNLMIMGDAEKAAEQAAKYMNESGLKKADAIIQLLPIHEMRRISLIVRSKGLFFAGLFKYDEDFEIDMNINAKECFTDPKEFAEFVEKRTDSRLRKASMDKVEPDKVTPKFSSRVFFN